jgi:hypothetical protein
MGAQLDLKRIWKTRSGTFAARLTRSKESPQNILIELKKDLHLPERQKLTPILEIRLWVR